MNTVRPRFGALSNSSDAMSRPDLARWIPQPAVRTPQFALPIPQVGISRGPETIPRAVEASRRRRLPSGAQRSTLRLSIFPSPRHRKSSRQRRSGSGQRRLPACGPKISLASRFFHLDGTGNRLDGAGFDLADAGNHLANSGSPIATTTYAKRSQTQAVAHNPVFQSEPGPVDAAARVPLPGRPPGSPTRHRRLGPTQNVRAVGRRGKGYYDRSCGPSPATSFRVLSWASRTRELVEIRNLDAVVIEEEPIGSHRAGQDIGEHVINNR